MQGARFVNYWHFGGREKKLGVTPEQGAGEATGKVTDAVVAARAESKKTAD